jgi:glycosyltransferase involved in cell wall biosynthesis
MILSIIIPIYKVEPYLRECLDSVAASPLDCWEAILIDDGSPDGCPQICDEYAAKDKRFRVIHQENAGVAAARNAGLDVAQGQWCWFVDSDDVVDMRPVGDMVTWLQGHQDVDLVMFDMETFDDNEDTSYDTLKLRNTSLRYADATKMVNVPVDVSVNKNDFLMKHVCYHHQRLWYRNDIINKNVDGLPFSVYGLRNESRNNKLGIRFTKGIRVAEDLEFQYKYLTLCQHPVKVDVVLYYYRLRETSVTGDAVYRQRAVEDLPIVLKNMAAWTRENDVKPEPWYDYRIMKLLQNLLYSASCIKNLEIEEFQKEIDIIIKDYTKLHFPFVRDIRIWLAKKNVKAYFMFYKTYLKLKGIQS